MIELRCGDWREVLSDVGECDAVITDPPYGARTHAKQFHGRRTTGQTGNWATRVGLGYAHLSPANVRELCKAWADRCKGWICAMTSHDLIPHYENTLRKAGRYVFKPLPLVMRGMNVRLAGDGPSSWSVDMVVSRPRSGPMTKWGTLPGAYVGNPFDAGQNMAATHAKKRGIVGAKPLWLMRAIIRDYTKPGDLIVDPFAGSGTTLIAARQEGRDCIGAELDLSTYAKAMARIEKPYTPELF